MSGSFATTTIITNGLHCGPACYGIITTHFSLYCGPPPAKLSVEGGGPYPYDAWNKVPDIHSFYQETPEQFYEVPRDKEADFFRKHVNVTVKLNIKGINIEKVYRVPEKRKYTVVKLFNILNATQARMTASIKNLKAIINKAKISIRNLRVRKK